MIMYLDERKIKVELVIVMWQEHGECHNYVLQSYTLYHNQVVCTLQQSSYYLQVACMNFIVSTCAIEVKVASSKSNNFLVIFP